MYPSEKKRLKTALRGAFFCPKIAAYCVSIIDFDLSIVCLLCVYCKSITTFSILVQSRFSDFPQKEEPRKYQLSRFVFSLRQPPVLSLFCLNNADSIAL